MKNELNLHQALKVFQKIVKHGVRVDNHHRLDGLSAESDFDGYTIVLQDDKVSLTIYFHNKYQVESPNKLSEDMFFEKLENIEKKKL